MSRHSRRPTRLPALVHDLLVWVARDPEMAELRRWRRRTRHRVGRRHRRAPVGHLSVHGRLGLDRRHARRTRARRRHHGQVARLMPIYVAQVEPCGPIRVHRVDDDREVLRDTIPLPAGASLRQTLLDAGWRPTGRKARGVGSCLRDSRRKRHPSDMTTTPDGREPMMATTDRPSGNDPPYSEREAYEAPVVTPLGPFGEVTLGKGHHQDDDGRPMTG